MSNPVSRSEQVSPAWPPRSTGRTRRNPGRVSVTSEYSPPRTAELGVHTVPSPTGQLLRWDGLDPIEQTLLVVASQEYTLGRACGSWAHRPRRPIAIEMTKHAAIKLFDKGLIGFYRVDDGYPDLGVRDVERVFADQSHWDCDHQNSDQVGIYLTTAGEDVVLGP